MSNITHWRKPIHLMVNLLVLVTVVLPSIVSAYALLDIRQDEKAKRLHRLDSLNILVYTLLLILTVCTIWLFKHRRVQFLHETGLAIIYGLIVGAIIRYVGQDSEVTHFSVIPESMANNCSNGTTAYPPSSSSTAFPMPPDALWIKLNIPVADHNNNNNNPHDGNDNTTVRPIVETVKRTYAYLFKGELSGSSDKTKSDSKQMSDKATFDPEIFFNIILPPIIFNAGYSLKRRFFFRNLGAIMTYAFIGTTISCFVVGSIMKLLVVIMSETFKEFSFNDCLYFGAIISATDPVTVLAIFNDLHVDVTVYALVFGESILNDAIAITLAGSIDSFDKHYDFGFFTAVCRAFGNFIYIFVLSFIQGSSIGCLTALVTKYTKLCDFPLLESTLFVLMSYSTFLMAEALELSGIVSVLFCGICQAHYTYNNLSDESRMRTKSLFSLCNFIAENFIFTYIGVSMFTFPRHYWSFSFIVIAFIAIAVGRALNVYPLSFVLNLGRNNKIPLHFQHVLFFSGLRGAMAFALAIRNTLTEPRRLMLTSTSLISIVTVIVCGGCTPALLQQLRVPTGVEEADHEMLQFSGVRRSASAQTPQDLRSPGLATDVPTRSAYEKAWLVRKWYNFDVRFMKPLLTHSRPSLMDTMPDCCLPLARILTTTQQMTADDYHRNPNNDSDDDLVLHGSGQQQGSQGFMRNNSTEYQSTDYLRSTNTMTTGAYITNSINLNNDVVRPTTLVDIHNNGVNNNKPLGNDTQHRDQDVYHNHQQQQQQQHQQQRVRQLVLPLDNNDIQPSHHLDSSFI
ncbi:sodium/hydrogen exchanger 6-like [Oppia nitens]|uniref:sodium/hydrogen exchanger 6-like n=1 Tax=Oppia nitens TaxID=1686743 RepID=UPI0023DB870F|nr:sodium/hydrogen exchanger 6-like [Oppia nitens]